MNSNLVTYTKISPHKNVNRTHAIDRVTIHCTAGNSSLAGIGSHFANPATKASANYAVDSEGRVGMYVEEKDRAWTSSSAENDQRAVTIEVVTESRPPYCCSEKALYGLIELLVDVCKRNHIAHLVWTGDPKNPGNMTVHRWFANTDCPGEYLMGVMGWIAERVNRKLFPDAPSTDLYRVQIGAFRNRENAAACLEQAKKAGFKDAFVTK